ncbi:MAG: protein-export chaperone SecB [Actinobacteria bacterium]|nr:protein-export chaperone SecB [Actinomycetota bacterium]
MGDLEVVPQHLRRRGDDDRHQLILSVAFLPREGAETQLPYHVEMKGRAFFHFDDPDLPDVEKSRMIKLNGASILFGLLRAEVAHVTALGRYGPMLLPAVNFIEAFRGRSREPAESLRRPPQCLQPLLYPTASPMRRSVRLLTRRQWRRRGLSRASPDRGS